MHRLRCFGRLAIEDEGGERVQLRSRKHLALLVYLAAHRDRRHERGRVARMFWDTELDLARHSLSQALYDLSNHVPGLELDRTNREIGLGPNGLVYEGEVFEEAVREDRLGEAVRLYDGSFAPDLETVGGPDFERWVERERTRFRSLAEKALLRRVSECADAGRWGEMVVAGNRLVDMNPLREEAHRAVMRGLWLRGDRSAALAHFDEHEGFLERESPGGLDEETRDLVRKIRHTDRSGGGKSVHERPRPEMVGREEEFRILKDTLSDVLEGESRFIVIRGEAGIGKTRLLEEFTEIAALEDVRLLESRCYAAESDVPYGPIIDGLEDLAREFGESSEGEDRQFYQLGHLFPEAFGEPEREEIYTTPTDVTRRLAEEFRAFLKIATKKAPIIWIIDDAHWIDRASFSLVSQLATRITGQPIAIIKAVRPAERQNERSPAIGEERNSPWELIDVAALDAEALRELIVQYDSSSSANRYEVERLATLTGGNPFYALELLQQLQEKRLSPAGSTVGDGRIGLGRGVERLLEARLSKHSSEEIQVLQSIAVAGRHANPQLIGSVAGLSLEELARVSSRLYQSGIIYDKEEIMAFKHDLLRHYVYENAGSLTRSTMHLAIANELRERGQAEPASLSKHFAAAGKNRETFDYACAAGKDAVERYAYDDALEFLDLAVNHAPSDGDKAQAQVLKAKAELALGRLTDAIRTSESALNAGVRSQSERVELMLLQGRAMVEMGDWEKAEKRLRTLQGGDLSETLSDELKLSWANYLLLKRAVRTNDPTLAEGYLSYIEDIKPHIIRDSAGTTSVPNVESANSAAIQKYTLDRLTLAGYNLFYEDVQEADSYVRDVEPVVEELPFSLRQQVYSLASIVSCRLAEWDRAIAFTIHAQREAKQRSDKWALTMAYLNRAVVEMERGNFDVAVKLIEKCKPSGSMDDKSNHAALVKTNIGDQNFYTENYSLARKAYEEAISLSIEREFTYLLPELYASRGLCLLAEGKTQEAKAVSSKVRGKDYLGGVQDRFKVYWLCAYWDIVEGNNGTTSLLRQRAKDEHDTDVPSALKSRWLADLFEAEFASSQLQGGIGDPPGHDYLKDSQLSWFAYRSRRWLRRVRAKNTRTRSR